MRIDVVRVCGLLLFSCATALASGASAFQDDPHDKTLADLSRTAIEKSQITLPDSAPFHLQAKVFEGTNPDNDAYNAEIEEYWAAPDKWRRTVKAGSFSQTLVVNGRQVHEELQGDYYPNWLRTIVVGIFEPGAFFAGLDLSKSSDNPQPDTHVVMPNGELYVQHMPVTCRRFAFRAGMPPLENNVFSTFCFRGPWLESVGMPGYHVSYKGYRLFRGKVVGRTLREYIDPGEEVEARIELLEPLETANEELFSVKESTPQLQTITVSEKTLWDLAADAPPVVWPSIHGGKAAGMLSIYVCIDRSGTVRETYGLNSDHPEMTDAAREQVSKWRFKIATSNGVPVQAEGILTFSYKAKLEPAPAPAKDPKP